MKNKLFLICTCLAVLVVAGLFSCKKKDPTPANSTIVDYPIPEVPVTSNYVVGAFYYTFTSFNANIVQ